VPESGWAACAFMSNCNTLRPYPNYGFLTWWSHYGDANYHALQALFKTRFRGALVNLSYTYSHSIGDVPLDESNGTANYQTLTLGSNPSLDRGNTQINRPHMLVANAVVPLPELKGSNAILRGIAGGWQVSPILTAESGPSTTIYQAGLSGTGGVNSLYGTGNAGPPWAPGANRRPFIVAGADCTAGASGPNIYNAAAFSDVGQLIGTLGNEPPGFCHGPKFVNTDMSLAKNWKIRERVTLQFRMDAFNMFNHPNFQPNANGGPVGAVTCGSAPCSATNNLITSETAGSNLKANAIINNNDREFQYGLRITF